HRRRQQGRRDDRRRRYACAGPRRGDDCARGIRDRSVHRRIGAGSEIEKPAGAGDDEETDGAVDSADAESTQFGRGLIMYEEYYGFSEKPFSLTPDPKYLYRSESHANAFDLLQY